MSTDRIPCLLSALLFFFLMSSSRAEAGEPRLPTGYRLDRWTTAEGLPSWQIRDLLQGPDGYLWIATPGGLVRFDGDSFRVIDRRAAPRLPANLVQAVYATRSGELWLGGDGYLLRLAPSGEAVPVASVEGVVQAVAEDATGRVWIYTSGGRLVYLDGGEVRTAPEETAEGFVTDRDGALWIRAADGEIVEVDGESRKPAGRNQVIPASPLWVLRRKPLAGPGQGPPVETRIVGDRVEARGADDGLLATWPAESDAVPWIFDRQGSLWIGRDGAVEAYRGASARPLFRQELGEGVLVSEILEDREGNLWIGTRAFGLFRLRPGFIETATDEHARLFRGFVRDEDGSLLVESSDGLFRVGRGLLVPYFVGGRRARARHVDPRGHEWHLVGDRLVGSGSDGRTVSLEVRDDRVRFANTPDAADGFWIATSNGLYRVETPTSGPSRIERRFADRIGGTRFLHADRRGRLWVGTGGGPFRVDGERLETTDGALHDLDGVDLRAVLEDDDGTLWFGSVNHGLLRVRDGGTARVDTSDGLAEDSVFAIVEDRAHRFWMIGTRGVHRALRSEIEARLDRGGARIRGARYGGDSGLVNPEEGSSLGTIDDDGMPWFSTHVGVLRIDPEMADDLTGAPPLVHIERLLSADRPVAFGAAAEVVLDPSERSIDVEFTAISLRDPEQVRFEVRLDPLNGDWVPVRRDRHARYANLRPGRYRFRVRAISGAGVWSEGEAALLIRVVPRFYETGWFRIGAVLGVLAVGYAELQRRVRAHRRREVELDRQVAERTAALARERDRAEEALAELERTNRIIESQTRELEALDAAKSRFFANVSHEFRTPLTLVLGPLDDVVEGSHGALPDDAQRQIEIAAQNARRLLRLVEQLLDTARLEAGRLKLQAREEDLHEFLERTARLFRPHAERRSIEFVVDAPDDLPRVWIDVEQLDKVLVNLLGNAFKFTGERGRIELRARADRDRMLIDVIDDGPGIPDEHLPHIFDRFYRAEADAAIQTGTGIGLALCRDLVELHHGSISVVAVSPRGTKFEVVLLLGREHLEADELAPEASALDRRLREVRMEERTRRFLPDASPAVPPSADAEGLDSDRTTILVVEDNPEMRAYVRRRLEPGYRVTEAEDGRAALAEIERLVPDLIVSDLMMPGMDGLELCRRVKADPRMDFVPIILLTAKASVGSRIEGLETGADDYLAKPFDGRELSARIDNLIASRRKLKARLAAQPAPVASDPGSEDGDLLAQLRRIVDEHLGEEEFGIDELSRAVGLSRRTLYRKLEELGESPATVILNHRLDRAAALLAGGQGNVSDVAYAVGFRSVSHFSRRFRERHGEAPSSRRPRRSGA